MCIETVQAIGPLDVGAPEPVAHCVQALELKAPAAALAVAGPTDQADPPEHPEEVTDVIIGERGRVAEAAHTGTHQVVGALIASTITTIAVFLPVVFLKDVEGQIFADLALTISIAVALSVIVAITVMPAAAGWLKAKKLKSGYGDGWP